jgi:SPP1 gp7 family putative phage head morphogenesis protein
MIIQKSRITLNKEKTKAFTNEIVKGIGEMLSTLKPGGKKDISQLSEKEFEPVYKAFAARVGKYEKAQRAIVIKVNDKIREEVISNLSKVVKTKAVNPAELYDQEKAVGIMIDLSKPNLYDLYEKEGIAAAALLGFNDIEMMTPAAKSALERALSLLSESYNDTTKELLRAKLDQGLADGLGIEEITKSVNAVFDYSDEVRASQVARTETFRIANESTKDAWKNTGVVKTIKWYTAEDERVCEFCGPMSEKIIGIDDNFYNKGDNVEGSDGGNLDLSYDDVGNPPLHVGCRCYQRPEEISLDKGAKKEEVEDEDKEIDKLLAAL